MGELELHIQLRSSLVTLFISSLVTLFCSSLVTLFIVLGHFTCKFPYKAALVHVHADSVGSHKVCVGVLVHSCSAAFNLYLTCKLPYQVALVICPKCISTLQPYTPPTPPPPKNLKGRTAGISVSAHDKKQSYTLNHQQSWALNPPTPPTPK